MMLVLTRKLGERLSIDSNIEIAVVQIRRNKVRLGVTAPRHIPVDRAEVRRRIQAGRAEQVNALGFPYDAEASQVAHVYMPVAKATSGG